MPVIRVLVMLATMMMKLVKTAKKKKVFKNVGVSNNGDYFLGSDKRLNKKTN
ncbi:hypothetical protein JP0078_08250 [Helicobacter pylori]|uniref:hypothetical protein n=1 Tax=Helicobacter pylori TaxID=210 RepID=UPI001AAA990E|nr:hypothetical protein JP0078_08250 [Helicobacter pylori]